MLLKSVWKYQLENPIQVFTTEFKTASNLLQIFFALKNPLHCNLHLFNLKMIEEDYNITNDNNDPNNNNSSPVNLKVHSQEILTIMEYVKDDICGFNYYMDMQSKTRGIIVGMKDQIKYVFGGEEYIIKCDFKNQGKIKQIIKFTPKLPIFLIYTDKGQVLIVSPMDKDKKILYDKAFDRLVGIKTIVSHKNLMIIVATNNKLYNLGLDFQLHEFFYTGDLAENGFALMKQKIGEEITAYFVNDNQLKLANLK